MFLDVSASAEERESHNHLSAKSGQIVPVPNYAEMESKVDLNQIFYEPQEPASLFDFLSLLMHLVTRWLPTYSSFMSYLELESGLSYSVFPTGLLGTLCTIIPILHIKTEVHLGYIICPELIDQEVRQPDFLTHGLLNSCPKLQDLIFSCNINF